jgi:hypothetical protein
MGKRRQDWNREEERRIAMIEQGEQARRWKRENPQVGARLAEIEANPREWYRGLGDLTGVDLAKRD